MSEVEAILTEITSVLSVIDSENELTRFAEPLQAAKRIFVVGEGRSGFMAKSFAMRLMHLGATAYVVGETITPPIAAGDVIVAVSGSGKTQSVLMVAEKARELGCKVLAVTTDPKSRLGELADVVLHVPAATKYRQQGEQASIQPLGSLFDQCTHLLLDAVCLRYAKLNSVNNEKAFARHSNLE